MPRHQILDEVWQQEFVGDGAVSSIISRLRKALADDARSPRHIETLPKRGYRLLPRPLDVLEVVAAGLGRVKRRRRYRSWSTRRTRHLFGTYSHLFRMSAPLRGSSSPQAASAQMLVSSWSETRGSLGGEDSTS